MLGLGGGNPGWLDDADVSPGGWLYRMTVTGDASVAMLTMLGYTTVSMLAEIVVFRCPSRLAELKENTRKVQGKDTSMKYQQKGFQGLPMLLLSCHLGCAVKGGEGRLGVHRQSIGPQQGRQGCYVTVPQRFIVQAGAAYNRGRHAV